MDFAIFLLKDFRSNHPKTGKPETTWITPGAGFYTNYMGDNPGNHQFRIANVLEAEKLSRAITVLGEGLTAYKNK